MAKCKRCHNEELITRRKQESKEIINNVVDKHSLYLWASSIVNDNSNQLDPRITPEYLIGLLTLQQSHCLVTKIPFCIPHNVNFDNDGKNYTKWFKRLNYTSQQCIPALAMFTVNNVILAGRCGFIINALIPFYKVNNGLDGMWHRVFHSPTFYQYSTVMEKVKELGLNGNNS